MRHLSIALALFILILAPWLAFNYADRMQSITAFFMNTADQLAAVVAHNPKTVAGLQSTYNIAHSAGKKIKILLVPGHEPDYGGAEYGSLKERNMTVELADDLAGILGNNDHYEVYVTRDIDAWTPTFAKYFKDNWSNIIDWENSYAKAMSQLVSIGKVPKKSSPVYHVAARQDVAMRLYGITKWANENDIDITIHIHFNDYPGHGGGVPGKYTGFAIYVPATQYQNGTTTRSVAQYVFNRLRKYNPVSDLPGENTGVVDDAELIAVGANDTADSASMLIEYGYIYEPQFVNEDTRDVALKDLAFQTYLGIQDFFGSGNDYSLAYDTLLLPYKWQRQIDVKSGPNKDIYALQTALSFDGIYPPADKNKNDCPRTGTFGACTKNALSDFQSKNDVKGERGIVGPKTLEALNEQFGGQRI